MYKKFIPYWFFLTLFKFGAGLHYSLLSPLGSRVFPLWIVGILIGFGSLLQLSLDVPAGYALDAYGYKRLLGFTTLVFIIAGVVLYAGITPITFILTIIFSSLGWLFFNPGINAYAISQAEGGDAGKFFATKDISMSLGVVLSSAMIIFAVKMSPEMISVLLIGILLCAYFAIFSAPRERLRHRKENKTATHRTRLEKNFMQNAFQAIRKLKPASTLLLSLTFSASVFYAIVWFVVPLLIAQSLTSGVLGIGLGIFDFSIVVLGFILGWLVDSYEKKLLILLGLLIFSLCGIFLGYNFGILFLMLGFLATTGDELASLSLWSWLYSLDQGHENDGLISGTINLFEDLGWTIGPVIAGICYTLIGPALTLSIGGIFILINLVLFLFIVQYPMPLPFIGAPRKPHRHRHKH
jgi:MFS family permease